MTDPPSLLGALPKTHRDRLLALARDSSFPTGERLFDEGGPADRFWLIRSGEVALDLYIPGRQAPVVETIGPGQLLGWSWLFPPYRWHLGAQTLVPVDAWEFPADQVRALCTADPELGYQLTLRCAEVIGERLQATRIRLLDLYAPSTGVS
ncbi:cyclic nucleotide-binding domain-containing protein [Kitasatospora sp. GP82]|uniref:cyclic nucleotide-binding domain-containing protein n=1 Tax=Kitasatospora sp. GP82 TaxID=3035089 RepID=UPI002474A65E|nr:cyclic nucleotide-binding domain-containing protein [Kitasatospora sp. GP82]MDH6127311.1 CRP-like cAMP-binding protein [Kitasatospora sp. GP82]